MKKVFYDSANNKQIIDVSGQLTVDDIKTKFGDVTYQEISIQDDEKFKIDDTDTLRALTAQELTDLQTEIDNNKISRLQDLITKKTIEKTEATNLGYTALANAKQAEIDTLQTELTSLQGSGA